MSSIPGAAAAPSCRCSDGAAAAGAGGEGMPAAFPAGDLSDDRERRVSAFCRMSGCSNWKVSSRGREEKRT